MSGNGNGRNRGIRLTDDAIRVIESRLAQMWLEQRRDGKLTRRGMAELLHLSEKTVDRVLRGERVDRATIKQAVQRLDIGWDEKFIVADVFTPEVAPAETRRASRSVRFLPVTAAVVAIASVGFWGGFRLNDSKTQPAPTWRVEFFARLAKGTDLYQKGNYSGANSEFGAALALAETHGDLSGMGEATRMIADIDMAHGRHLVAREGYIVALKYKEKTGQTSTYPAIQQAIGVAELKLKHYSTAKGWMRIALDGFVAVNDSGGIAMVQRDLGSLCAAQGDWEGALAWFASARSGTDRATNAGLLMDVRAREALVYLRLGEVEKADQMLTDCLEFWERERHPRWIARTKLQLSHVKEESGEQRLADRLRFESALGFRQIGDSIGAAEAEERSTHKS